MESKEPKILFFDIETSHNVVAVFQLKDNNFIDPSNILTERYIICASWKWEGDPRIYSVSVLDDPNRFREDPNDDRHVVETLHSVLNEADVIIGHNSDSFDKRYIDTRILALGLDPLPPITSIDTYKVAKSKFLLNSNRLDYIGKLLGVGRKKHTSAGLWIKALRGDDRAIKDMVAYNKQDVVLLEKVFKKLRPYCANHINRELFGEVGCPRCGSTKVQSRGFHRAISRIYRRFCCNDCGGWFRSAVNEKDVALTSRVL